MSSVVDLAATILRDIEPEMERAGALDMGSRLVELRRLAARTDEGVSQEDLMRLTALALVTLVQLKVRAVRRPELN